MKRITYCEVWQGNVTSDRDVMVARCLTRSGAESVRQRLHEDGYTSETIREVSIDVYEDGDDFVTGAASIVRQRALAKLTEEERAVLGVGGGEGSGDHKTPEWRAATAWLESTRR